MNSHKTFILLITLFFLSLFNNSYALLIDDFSSGFNEYPGTWVYGAPGQSYTPIASSTQTGTMLGGERTIDLELLSGNGFVPVTVESYSNKLSIANGVSNITLATLTWDKMNIPLDITSGGLTDGIYISMLMDINPITMGVRLFDGINTSHSESSFTSQIDSAFIAFDDIIGDADMTAINSLQFYVTSTDLALDINIFSIETRSLIIDKIPEPNVLFLFFIGLLIICIKIKGK